jgi:two-component system NarL family response regulator
MEISEGVHTMSKPPEKLIRILIVDDHPAIRVGLTSMLGTQAELEVVGAAASSEDALTLLQKNVVDIVLLDLRMPGTNGSETMLRMKRAGHTARVIILTSFDTDEDIYGAVRAGAQGYLLKDASLKEMAEAVQAVHAGRKHLPSAIAARLADRMMRPDLTARELEILKMVARGLTNRDIGHALEISSFTVKNHVNSIIEKLEVGDRTEAATISIQKGIIRVEN